MTVPATARRAGPYNGNGSTTSFSFSFKTFAAADLLVTKTNTSGVETVLVLNSQYSVTLNGDQDASPGGSITYPISGSPLAVGEKIAIVGNLQYEQTTDLLGGGAFNARVIEDTFDRATIQIQQIEERADRALVVPITDPTTVNMALPGQSVRASKLLGFNASGNPTQSSSTVAAIDAAVAAIGTIAAASPGSSAGISHIAAGSGAVATTVQAKLRETVSVKDFGAVGNGVADDTTAIQAAVTSLSSGATLLFPPGTYKLSSEVLFNGKTNIDVFGFEATIKGTSTRFRSYFNVCGADKIRFFGLEFDMMFGTVQQYLPADYPNLYNVGIFGNGYIGSVGTVEVYNCRFKNLYTDGIFIFNAERLKVENCDFTSPAQNQNQIIEHISTGTIGTVEVYKCSFVNVNPGSPNNGVCGIVLSGVRTRGNVEDCNFEYCGRNNAGSHRLAVIDLYYDGNNITIRNNRARNTLGQFMRLSACWNGRIEGNYVHHSGNGETGYNMLSVEGYYFGGPPAVTNVGTRNVIVCNNVFDDEFNRQEICVGVFGYDWGLPSRNVQVHNNVILGAKFAVLVSGAFQNVSIKDNDIYGYFSLIDVRGNTNAPTITSLYGTQANSAMENLVIQGNSILNTAVGAPYQITIVPGPLAQYQGTINFIKIFDNRIVSSAEVGSGGVAINCNQSTKTAYILIDRNTTQNCATDYYIRGAYKVVITNNVAGGTVTQFYLDDGSNNYVQRRFNQLSVEQHQGTATLVAGQVTVTTNEVKTGDTVILSRGSAGGTLGDLYVDNIVNGTSFRINSTSATDTSVVFYEIVH